MKLQAALFKKILSYDTAFKSKPGKLVVLLTDKLNDLDRAFKDAGFEVKLTSVENLAQSMTGSDVLYVPSNLNPAVYKDLCEKKGLLSITSSASLVEKGHVSIGLGLKGDGRPLIIVNIKRLQAEKHELLSDLLTLAKVIR